MILISTKNALLFHGFLYARKKNWMKKVLNTTLIYWIRCLSGKIGISFSFQASVKLKTQFFCISPESPLGPKFQMCIMGGSTITSKTKINVFWNFFFTPLAPSLRDCSIRKNFKKCWFQPLRQTVHCPAKMRPKLWKSHIVHRIQ